MQDSECVLNQHCKYLVSTLGSWQKNEKLTGCTRPKQKPRVSRLHCDIHSSAKRKTLTILSLPAVDIDNAIITRLKPTNKIQYVTISYPETGCNIIKQSLTSSLLLLVSDNRINTHPNIQRDFHILNKKSKTSLCIWSCTITYDNSKRFNASQWCMHILCIYVLFSIKILFCDNTALKKA